MRFWKGWCGVRDYRSFAMIVGMERFGVAIPPVVARILSGDSTSPLTREASVMVRGEAMDVLCEGCGDGEVRCNGRGKLYSVIT